MPDISAGQQRTGVEREESGPVGGNKSGDGGETGGQSRTGYDREDSAPVGGTKSGEEPLGASSIHWSKEESSGSKDWPSGRLDEIEEV